MAQVTLNAEKRSAVGTQKVKQLRRSGYIPAIVYGRHTDTFGIQIDEKEFLKLAHGTHGASLESILINLDIKGDKPENRLTLIKEIQHNPFSGKAVHIDFNEVSLTEKIHTHIPVIVVGESKGEKQGGILDQSIREIEVACLPNDLPEEVKVDVSDLDMHQSIHVKDLDIGDKVDILTDADLSIVSVIVPRVVEEAATEEVEEEALEPEVIGKKEGEEEEEEGSKEEK